MQQPHPRETAVGEIQKRYDSIDDRGSKYVTIILRIMIINMWKDMYGRDAVDAAQPDNHFYILLHTYMHAFCITE